MKPIREIKNTGKVQTNAKESTEFSIGSPGKIMEILRNKIYSEPKQTLVQEYLANARDAGRESGNSTINVTLLDDSISIRDFGPGIDRERMKLFCQYGSSTKENTNEQNGGFGLGSKLAWAYTDKFSIITYINGLKTEYLAHIGTNKNGVLDLVSESQTDEKNGTEIVVPIDPDDYQEFRDAVTRATMFWQDTEKPFIDGHRELFSDRVVLFPAIDLFSVDSIKDVFGTQTEFILAIDGVPYPLSKNFISESFPELDYDLVDGAAIVLHVANGLIEVSANRENISENDNTSGVIAGKIKQACESLEIWKQNQFKKPGSLQAFVDTSRNVQRYISIGDAKYTEGGETFKITTYNGFRLRSDKIDALTVTHYDSPGNKKSGRRSYSKCTEFDLNHEIVCVDEKLSQAKINAKCGELVSGEFLLVSGDETYISKLAKKLNLPVTSSVTLAKKERAERESLDESEVRAEVLISEYRSNKKIETQVIDLDDDSKGWIYLAERTEDLDKYSSLRELAHECGYKVCFLKPRALERVQGNDNFVSLETFVSDMPSIIGKDKFKDLLDLAVAEVVQFENISPRLAELPKTHYDKIQDPKLRTSLHAFHTEARYRGVSIDRDDFLMQKLMGRESKLVALKSMSENFPAYLKANYALLYSLNAYEGNREVWSDELKKHVKVKSACTEAEYHDQIVNYLNGAFKK